VRREENGNDVVGSGLKRMEDEGEGVGHLRGGGVIAGREKKPALKSPSPVRKRNCSKRCNMLQTPLVRHGPARQRKSGFNGKEGMEASEDGLETGKKRNSHQSRLNEKARDPSRGSIPNVNTQGEEGKQKGREGGHRATSRAAIAQGKHHRSTNRPRPSQMQNIPGDTSPIQIQRKRKEKGKT